ncbi:HET-domain-containing protein [Apiospora hydei]|uniref:HET-domain-containing protein n=1 Tax=Apiospora hydei TaxID=1337664 RepID=A0ABR1WCK2_9PEZI
MPEVRSRVSELRGLDPGPRAPPSLCSKAPVEVRIREVSLFEARIIKYEALSYARVGDTKRRGLGGSNKSSSVVVVGSGGQRLPVTDNCHAALVRLRRRLWTRTLWVDAVCIDQAEDEAGAKGAQPPGSAHGPDLQPRIAGRDMARSGGQKHEVAVQGHQTVVGLRKGGEVLQPE